MHKKNPKICTGCKVSAAKIYLYHSIKIAKARPHSKEWQTDTSVQKQWSMPELTDEYVPFASVSISTFFLKSYPGGPPPTEIQKINVKLCMHCMYTMSKNQANL